ncbi:MAG: hypothetical protein ABJF23_12100 [Bryobacteraceae bacterium]
MSASDPVIIDDGGSTRIRFLLDSGVGAMDGLLDVGELSKDSPAPGSQGSQHIFTPPDRPLFTDLTIVFTCPKSATPTTVQVALAPGDKVVVTSGPLTVQLDIDSPRGSGNSVLTNFGSATSGVPLVGAKQQNKKRRYFVSAAPPISLVNVTLGGQTSTVFDAAKTPSAYTQVFLR